MSDREHPLVTELKHRIAHADDLGDPCAGSDDVETTIRKINIVLCAGGSGAQVSVTPVHCFLSDLDLRFRMDPHDPLSEIDEALEDSGLRAALDGEAA